MVFIRPMPVLDPARGLLHNEHYHIGYVTNDIERASRLFRERFGVSTFRETFSQMSGGGSLSLRSVWIGNMMFEITCGLGPGMELYSDHAPADGDFVLAFHHLGYLVADDASWALLRHTIASEGWHLRLDADIPGYCRAIYVEAPELGHYLEFVQPAEGLSARLNATPVA
ncbi:MAG: VOC family protein [Novosphingobium sp.]|nr:VOC family protein [Novosphingobium sp.]